MKSTKKEDKTIDDKLDEQEFNPPTDILEKEAKHIINKGRIDEVAYSTLDNICGQFREEYRKKSKQDIRKKRNLINKLYREQYNDYMRGGYKQNTQGLSTYSPKDFSSKYLRQLNNRIDTSLGLIVSHHEAYMSEVVDRFKNWFSVPSEEIRGKVDTPESLQKNLSKFINHDEVKFKKHMKFVIKDQAQKLTASMDEITATEGGAIGFIWKTRRDSKVVGDPSGKYPEGTAIHQNHYKRENKFYLIKNSWAIQQGFIKKTSEIQYEDELEDGRPGIPIACRCTAIYIFSLEDIPSEYKSILTKKGLKEVENA